MFHSLFFPAHREPHNSLLFILKIIKSESFAQTDNRMISTPEEVLWIFILSRRDFFQSSRPLRSPTLILMNETDKINLGWSLYYFFRHSTNTNLFNLIVCQKISPVPRPRKKNRQTKKLITMAARP